ncbi:MAG: IS110 family transposase [Acidobacteriota bacterium]
MKFYCAIDLSARDCHVCVIDEQLRVIGQQKLRNALPKIVQLLEPYKANLQIVVESTFNWYWLIDGLQAEGFKVILAHTLGLYLITRAKVKTDRRDAYALAKLLLVGAVPKAYIYPVETRPVRDLLRRRLHLVQVRAGEYGSLRRVLLRQGILSSKQQEIKTATEAELEQWFEHPLVRCTPARNCNGLNSTRNRSESWKRPSWTWRRPTTLTICCGNCRVSVRPLP